MPLCVVGWVCWLLMFQLCWLFLQYKGFGDMSNCSTGLLHGVGYSEHKKGHDMSRRFAEVTTENYYWWGRGRNISYLPEKTTLACWCNSWVTRFLNLIYPTMIASLSFNRQVFHVKIRASSGFVLWSRYDRHVQNCVESNIIQPFNDAHVSCCVQRDRLLSFSRSRYCSSCSSRRGSDGQHWATQSSLNWYFAVQDDGVFPSAN